MLHACRVRAGYPCGCLLHAPCGSCTHFVPRFLCLTVGSMCAGTRSAREIRSRIAPYHRLSPACSCCGVSVLGSLHAHPSVFRCPSVCILGLACRESSCPVLLPLLQFARACVLCRAPSVAGIRAWCRSCLRVFRGSAACLFSCAGCPRPSLFRCYWVCSWKVRACVCPPAYSPCLSVLGCSRLLEPAQGVIGFLAPLINRSSPGRSLDGGHLGRILARLIPASIHQLTGLNTLASWHRITAWKREQAHIGQDGHAEQKAQQINQPE